MKILETERTIIREFTKDDTNQLYSIFSNKNVMKFIKDGEGLSFSETSLYIDQMIKRYNDDGYSFWAIESKQTKEIIGYNGFMHNRSTQLPELGYIIDQPHWRKGLALETTLAVLEYSKEELNISRLIAYTKKKNIPSQELMKKIGMSLWKKYSKNNVDYVEYDYYHQ